MDQGAVCPGSDWTDQLFIISFDMICERSMERRSIGQSKHAVKSGLPKLSGGC